MHLGRRVAEHLLERFAGESERGTGWRGALQSAATLTENDPGILLIADEVYRAAPDLRAPAGVRAYAMSTLAIVPEGPGHDLLLGMLDHTDSTDDG